jgi:hypothetical protein
VCGTFNVSLRTTQDYDLWFRLAEKFRFLQVPGALVKGRQHEAQGSVTMKHTALKEINTLLSGFTMHLTAADLRSFGHKSVCRAYVEIAASFWRRRFYSAALLASRMAIASFGKAPLCDDATSACYLCRAITWAAMRNLGRYFIHLKTDVDMRIKNFWGPIKYRLLQNRKHDLQEKFSLIYSGNIFGGKKSVSGTGSDLRQTQEVRRVLPALLDEFDIQTMLDAPCGDLFWMKTMQLGVKQYIGADIVEDLIKKNSHEFGSDIRKFLCLNLTQDKLPSVDLIFCRDCLVHLNFADVRKVLNNFKRSGSRYLLTTTFAGRDANRDLIGRDIWRTLNLQVAPFNLPEPLRLINEKCTEGNGAYADKSLGLWRLSDI